MSRNKCKVGNVKSNALVFNVDYVSKCVSLAVVKAEEFAATLYEAHDCSLAWG